MKLTFTINGHELSVKSMYFIAATVLVADHPETNKPCLFLKEPAIIPEGILKRLEMKVRSLYPKYYNEIPYYELEEFHGSETITEREERNLRGKPRHKGVGS